MVEVGVYADFPHHDLTIPPSQPYQHWRQNRPIKWSGITADPNSYGFRKGRCVQDAIEQCFNVFGQPGSAVWILEGDIQACFDHISHEWLAQHIPIEKSILRQWLKAGYLEKGQLFPTEAGTPQGGIITLPTMWQKR